MKFRKLLVWFCLGILIATIIPACGEAPAEDPIVVRVGKVEYPLSVVQSSLSATLDFAGLLTDAVTDEDRAASAEATIEKFIGLGLIENKLSEKGKNDFTEEEQEMMKSAAQARYEELWQALYQRARQSDEAVGEEDITGWLEGEGYTVEAIYDEYVVSERNHRAIELFCPDVTITQAQADQYYEEQFVAPDRERYEGNVELFEQEIVSANNESFYIPEGYRYIRQITLDYPKEATAAAKAQENRMSNAVTALATAFQKLAIAATTAEGWDDMVEPRSEYDKANETAIACREAYIARLEETARPLLQDTLDAIRERLDAGIDFLSLIETYSSDKTDQNLSKDGYLFHPDSTTWPDAFKEATMTLENPGDVSDPVYSETGVHILYYAGEAPAGDHVLTDEERDQLNASALTYYQNLRLEELFQEWKPDYDIETHPELLEY